MDTWGFGCLLNVKILRSRRRQTRVREVQTAFEVSHRTEETTHGVCQSRKKSEKDTHTLLLLLFNTIPMALGSSIRQEEAIRSTKVGKEVIKTVTVCS